MDARNDAHTIEPAARGTVPLGEDQDVALGERVNRRLELRAVLDVFRKSDCWRTKIGTSAITRMMS